MPLLSEEIPIETLNKNSEKTFITTSSLSFKENSINTTPNIKEQANLILKEINNENYDIIIDFKNNYSKSFLKFFEFRNGTHFRTINIDDKKYITKNKNIIYLGSLERLAETLEKLKGEHKNIIGTDSSAIRESHIDLISKSITNNTYKYIANVNSKHKYSVQFQNIYLEKCSKIQKEPTYLNISTFDALSVAKSIIKNKKTYYSELIGKEVMIDSRKGTLTVETF